MLTNEGAASEEVNEIRRILYGLPFPKVSESAHRALRKHNAEVKHYFRDRGKDLLIVDWEEGDGWKELCNFLGKDIPDEDFPHANKGTYKKKSDANL
jgi:hypothetical protein